MLTMRERLEAMAPLQAVRWRRDGFSALCPVHDDSTPSLDVDPGRNERIVVLCHACGKAATPAMNLAAGHQDLYRAKGWSRYERAGR